MMVRTTDPSAGSWAGHELTHGFDDQGRHFDAHGNLRDWWTPADSAAFVRQADLMVQQYNGYVQVDSLHVNGRLTLGENIADFGGVLTGYDALEAALGPQRTPGSHRWPHTRAAVLRLLRAELARQRPSGRPARTCDHGSALTGQMAHHRSAIG